MEKALIPSSIRNPLIPARTPSSIRRAFVFYTTTLLHGSWLPVRATAINVSCHHGLSPRQHPQHVRPPSTAHPRYSPCSRCDLSRRHCLAVWLRSMLNSELPIEEGLELDYLHTQRVQTTARTRLNSQEITQEPRHFY